MKEFINYLERKIDGCDALGRLEREKAVYQSVLKEYRKAIKVIPCCKSDSEQLFAFLKYHYKGSLKNPTDEELKKYIEIYLSK